MASLHRHAAALARRDIEGFLDELLTRIEPHGDDAALLALRVPAPHEGGASEPSAPPQHAHSPAAAERAAPGSGVEGAPVRDTSERT
jgi:hypothetical protein